MRISWLALALLAGCSPWSISQQPLDPAAAEAKGCLAIRLEGEKDAALGYSFSVRKPDGNIVSHYLINETPVEMKDLEPGRYEIEVFDPRSGRAKCEVKVRRKSETKVAYAPDTAYGNTTLEEMGVVTGKTVFYTVAGIFYVTIVAILEIGSASWESNDSSCSICSHSPCRCPKREAAPPRAPKDEPKPRVRDVLKNP